jgi:uncharacterized membrane protein
MVLELKAPDEATFPALWPLWPTAISYAVSYLFIAIIWINHHRLMRFVGHLTQGLIWINFVHLFLVSLVPFTTAWVASIRLASSAIALYAGLFVCIDIAATSSNTTSWRVQTPLAFPNVCAAWQGADRSVSWQASPPPWWLRLLGPMPALV